MCKERIDNEKNFNGLRASQDAPQGQPQYSHNNTDCDFDAIFNTLRFRSLDAPRYLKEDV